MGDFLGFRLILYFSTFQASSFPNPPARARAPFSRVYSASSLGSPSGKRLNTINYSSALHCSEVTTCSLGVAVPPSHITSEDATPTMADWFAVADTDGDGYVSGAEAVQFFQRAGLPQLSLAKLWELADNPARGYLERKQFDIALQLITIAQVSAFLYPRRVCPPRVWNRSFSVSTEDCRHRRCSSRGQIPFES